MPSPTPNFAVSSECPFMMPGITTVITPVWQPESGSDDDDTVKEAEAKPTRLDENHGLDALSESLGESVYDLAQHEGFSGARGKTLVLRIPPGKDYSVKRVVLLGLGKPKTLTLTGITEAYQNAFKQIAGWDEALHQVAASVVKDYERFGGALFTEESQKEAVGVGPITSAIVCGAYNASYASTEAKKAGKALAKITLIHENPEAVNAALSYAKALNEGKALAKDLVNKPANTKTTSTMKEAALAIAEASGGAITADIVEDVAWIKKEMPCFYQVARGSVETDPPKFIHLHYKGTNASRKIALVGKSVIFDTGGYQVKPGNYMVTMKGDMAGGASVLGVAKALAELKPDNIEVDIYLAATPNKIDSDAMIPDSIVDTTCGKKVEIRHTDAEGRLTLIDAVTKAADKKPEAIVTIATLTGAAKMFVGETIALMANNTEWRDKVEAAAKASGDPVQALDVRPDDFENIKSKLDGADIRNTNRGSSRGSQTAGAFVMSGAPEGMPVVHLDIAGADMYEDETASAYSVGTLLKFVTSLS